MKFEDEDLRRIKVWSERLDRDVSIRLLRTDDDRSALLGSFCAALAAEAPRVRVVEDREEGHGPPSLLVGERVVYRATPKGAELGPFLDALSGDFDSDIDERLKSRIEDLHSFADFEIFITNQCPFCPFAVRRFITLASLQPLSRVMITDGTLFPELAEAYRVMSVPTVIVNGAYRLSGQIRLSEAVEMIETSDPSNLGPDILKRMLKEGQAAALAGMMLRSRAVFPSFLPLIIHSEWSVRLGAMVVLEEIAETDKAFARTALAALWEKMGELSAPMRGDIVYLAGKLEDRSRIEALKVMLERETDEELRAVIAEALSELE